MAASIQKTPRGIKRCSSFFYRASETIDARLLILTLASMLADYPLASNTVYILLKYWFYIQGVPKVLENFEHVGVDRIGRDMHLLHMSFNSCFCKVLFDYFSKPYF